MRLISDAEGYTIERQGDVVANLAAVREVHDDVIADLMSSNYPMQKRVAATGATAEGAHRARRRVCV